MNREDYIAGGHHFWIHFWFGLVLGAGFGLWISSGFSDHPSTVIVSTSVIALVIAFSAGRWGDPIWRGILWCLSWLRSIY